MGTTLKSIYLFLYVKKKYAFEFKNTITLGRQELHLSSRQLKRLNQTAHLGMKKEQVKQLAGETFDDLLIERLFHTKMKALDYSEYQGADLIWDLNTEIPEEWKESVSCLIDGGTLEHVYNFPKAIENCMKLVKKGGFLIFCSPANNFCGHGYYQFSPELFRSVLKEENGFQIKDMFFVKPSGSGIFYRLNDSLYRGNRRLEVNYGVPTELYVVAEKLSGQKEKQELKVWQSDYVKVWKEAKKSEKSEGGGAEYGSF